MNLKLRWHLICNKEEENDKIGKHIWFTRLNNKNQYKDSIGLKCPWYYLHKTSEELQAPEDSNSSDFQFKQIIILGVFLVILL